MSDTEYNRAGQWTFAMIISVVLHVVGLGALMIFSGSGKQEVKPVEPKTEARSNEEIVERPKPETKPETKSEAKPEAKPESKPEKKPSVKPEKKSEIKPETKPEKKVEKSDEHPAQEVKPSPAAPTDYVVVSGDNLTVIARRFGVTPAEIAEANGKNLKQMSRLLVGQRIRIPAKK